jgi:acyl-CoA thioesterase FadM
LHAQTDPADAVAFVVRRMEIDFRSPARMDDVLTIVTTPAEVRGARMLLSQAIMRDDQVLAAAEVTVAVINGFRPGAAATGCADAALGLARAMPADKPAGEQRNNGCFLGR